MARAADLEAVARRQFRQLAAKIDNLVFAPRDRLAPSHGCEHEGT